jgi:hypothetical protein
VEVSRGKQHELAFKVDVPDGKAPLHDAKTNGIKNTFSLNHTM